MCNREKDLLHILVVARMLLQHPNNIWIVFNLYRCSVSTNNVIFHINRISKRVNLVYILNFHDQERKTIWSPCVAIGYYPVVLYHYFLAVLLVVVFGIHQLNVCSNRHRVGGVLSRDLHHHTPSQRSHFSFWNFRCKLRDITPVIHRLWIPRSVATNPILLGKKLQE